MLADITEALVYATDDPLRGISPLAVTDGYAHMAGLNTPAEDHEYAPGRGMDERLGDAVVWHARIEPADLGELHRLVRRIRFEPHASVSYRLAALPGGRRVWVSDLLVWAVSHTDDSPRYHGVRTLHGDDGAGTAAVGDDTLTHALEGFIHAIRQPLNRIGLAVANARMELGRGTESREYLDNKLERIVRSAEQAAGLLHELPALARGREHATVTQAFPLSSLVESLISAGITRTRLLLSPDTFSDDCTLACSADPGMLAALIHATADVVWPGDPAAVSLALTVSRQGNRVRLTLTPTDTGRSTEVSGAQVQALTRVLARMGVDVEQASADVLRLVVLAQ